MPRSPSLENQRILLECLAAYRSLGFNQSVRLTGLDTHSVSRVLKYLAEKKIVVRTEQGRGRKTLYSLSLGWEPYGKKVFERLQKKRMRRSPLAREIERHSVHFGLPGQVTWEELEPLLKPSEYEWRLGALRKWRTSIKQRPKLARISPLPYAELKPETKKLETLAGQQNKRLNILTKKTLGCGWQEPEIRRVILRETGRNIDV
jgi:hypothetical protein